MKLHDTKFIFSVHLIFVWDIAFCEANATKSDGLVQDDFIIDTISNHENTTGEVHTTVENSTKVDTLLRFVSKSTESVDLEETVVERIAKSRSDPEETASEENTEVKSDNDEVSNNSNENNFVTTTEISETNASTIDRMAFLETTTVSIPENNYDVSKSENNLKIENETNTVAHEEEEFEIKEENKLTSEVAEVRNADPDSGEMEHIHFNNEDESSRRAYPDFYQNYGYSHQGTYGFPDIVHGVDRSHIQRPKYNYGLVDPVANHLRNSGSSAGYHIPFGFYSDLFQKDQGVFKNQAVQEPVYHTSDPYKALRSLIPEFTYRASDHPEVRYDFSNLHSNAYPYTPLVPEDRSHNYYEVEERAHVPGHYYPQNFNMLGHQRYNQRYRRNIRPSEILPYPLLKYP